MCPTAVKVENKCLQCHHIIDMKERYCYRCKNIMKHYPNIRRNEWGKFLPYEVYGTKNTSILVVGGSLEDVQNDEVVKQNIKEGHTLVWCNVLTNQGGFLGLVPF